MERGLFAENIHCFRRHFSNRWSRLRHIRSIGFDLFFHLFRVTLNKIGRKVEQWIEETICFLNLALFGKPEIFLEFIEQAHIATCKTIDGLPIVAHAEKFGKRILGANEFQEIISVY